ncbi:hypothetical protein [Maricaulis maris]|uniref:hypothetical protein n=1 Tax=Maricaulis maris TaxID=74318 RepID=UPI003B8B419A
MFGALIAVVCAACVSSGPHVGAQDELDVTHGTQSSQCHQADLLDASSYPGTVRARGLFGLVRVRGTLSFVGGDLVWSTQGETESGAYRIFVERDECIFIAEYTLDSGGQVRWTGVFDGQRVHTVRIIWTRVTGDAVHDLLLPNVVALEFTPDS